MTNTNTSKISYDNIKDLCKNDNCHGCGILKKRIIKNKNSKNKHTKNTLINTENILNELAVHFCPTMFSELSVITDESNE